MKDIRIPASRIRKEGIWLLISLIVSLGFNFYSIIRFHTAWKELITQIHVVIILALIVYVLILLLRLLAGLVIRFAGVGRSRS